MQRASLADQRHFPRGIKSATRVTVGQSTSGGRGAGAAAGMKHLSVAAVAAAAIAASINAWPMMSGGGGVDVAVSDSVLGIMGPTFREVRSL